MPVAETQAGKGALAWDHPLAIGAVGVTGGSAANALAAEADAILAIGTRLSDFTTASRSLFRNAAILIQLNVAPFDAVKHGALPLIANARTGLEGLDKGLASWTAPSAWTVNARRLAADWNDVVAQTTAPSNTALPSDAQVLGAVNRAAAPGDIVVCAAGGLPGELHKLWRCREPGTYHVEYGYSCMGYEIAGALGVKLALPEREIWVLVGDGSYLMMNSEIATSVILGKKLNIVLLNNGGFGCIDRLQRACGGASFNNLFANGSGSISPRMRQASARPRARSRALPNLKRPSALLINSVIGLAALAAVEMTRIGPEFISHITNQARPWFVIPGLLGTFFVFASLYGYKHQGAAPTIVLVIAAQLLTGLVLDSVGLTGASPALGVCTVIGAVLLVVGACPCRSMTSGCP